MDSDLIEVLQELVPEHAGLVTKGIFIVELYQPLHDNKTLAVYGANVAPWDALGMMTAVSADIENIYARIPNRDIYEEEEDG